MRSTEDASIGKRSTSLVLLASLLLGVGMLASQHVMPAWLVKWAFAGAAAFLAAVWILAYPTRGLYLSVFYIYAGVSYYFQIHAAYPIVVLVSLAAFLHLVRGEPLRLPSVGFNWSLVLFTVIALTSMLWAHEPELSFFGLSLWLKTVVLIYLVVHLLRTPRDVDRFALVIFAASISAVLLGLMNVKLGWVRDERLLHGWLRFAATHGDPNLSAVFLASALPLGAYIVRRYKSWAIRVGAIVGTLLIMAAAFSTLSRAAIFPITFVVLAVAVRDLRRYSIMVIVPLAILTPVLIPAVYWQRLLSLEQVVSGVMGDFSLLMRYKAAVIAWDLFLAHPWTGVGLENFVLRSAPDLPIRLVVHNAFLEVLVGVGIFGFAAFAMMFVTAYRHFRDAMTASWPAEHSWMRHLSFYLLVSVISTLISGMFLSIWYAYLIWLPLAGGLAAGRLARERQSAIGGR